MRDQRIQRAMGVFKKEVSAFSFSWKKKREAATQKELKLPKHTLITESPTRWRSRHAMMARVLDQEKTIAKVSTVKKNKALGSLMAGHWCQGVCPQGSKSTCWLLWCPIWLSICECFIPETCATALQCESLKARSWWLSAHQDHQSYCHQLSEWEI